MKNENTGQNVPVDEEEVDAMPSIELVEHERTAYIKGMENYLQNLRQMSNSEAVRKS